MRSDVDILCRDKLEFAEHIIKNISGFEIKSHTSGTHFQVDLYENNRLHLKFDLIDSLEEYGLYADPVFRKKRAKLRQGVQFWVPQDVDELQIRLVEYKKNPKKTWHGDYIVKHGPPGLLSDMGSRDKV